MDELETALRTAAAARKSAAKSARPRMIAHGEPVSATNSRSCNDPSAFNEWLGADETGLPFRPDEEPSLGSHLLIELLGCDHQTIIAFLNEIKQGQPSCLILLGNAYNKA